MNAFISKPLTNQELQRRADLSWTGTIQRVVPQRVFNRWRFTKDEVVPVIEFADGVTWIPNQRARKLLTEEWGADTDHWIGRRMRIFLKEVARTEEVSGRGVNRQEKFVEPLDDEVGEAPW